jgi:hypothetical protein
VVPEYLISVPESRVTKDRGEFISIHLINQRFHRVKRCRKSLKSSEHEQSLSKFSRTNLSSKLNPYIQILSHFDAKFDDPIVFKDCNAKGFEKAIKGKKVVAAKRWGKYFWYHQFPSTF